MREITMTEFYNTAEACSRMFPDPKWSYLRSALQATVLLRSASTDFLDRGNNRAYYEGIRAVNIKLYRLASGR